MNRFFVLTGALVLGVILCTVAQADDKEASIKTVMKKAHAKGVGLLSKIQGEVKGKKWDDAASDAKEWVGLSENLGKATPPKGEAASWKKLTTSYEKNIKDLAAATEKKDAAKANAALKKVGTSCGACHSAHKGK